MLEPHDLQVLSWVPGGEEPQFLPVMCLTRRDYDGDLVDVSLKTGRRIRTTPDHGWIVGDGAGGEATFKLAGELTTGDWVPLALGTSEQLDGSRAASLVGAAEAAELSPKQLIVRPARAHIDSLVTRPIDERRRIFGRSAAAARTGDIKRTGSLRYDEPVRAEIPLEGSTISTTKNGNQPRSELVLDERFWRVLGLYLAEGHVSIETGGRHRIQWSFHPTREQHLVDEVVGYWLSQNVKAIARPTATAQTVSVSSRLLGTWWTQVLGLGRGSYEQRLPDLLWDQSDAAKWAVLSGLFEGDGSWSLVNGGPSVIIEFGTVSDELADGVLRLLASLGIVASERTGRVAKSTKDTHWLRISGAEQVERAIRLIPERDRAGVLASIARQHKRIAPTGHRRFGDGPAWLRVTSLKRDAYRGPVYSLEVPYTHTVAATNGVVLANCFPKDVSALKQLAGNSGYHFQLLTAVIEVNELQKRRVVSKLQKHLGSLVGKRIGLLGLAFKPDTDDMREASSLVLSARLQADGATVAAYDPVAEQEARKLMPGVHFADSALAAVRDADACVLVTEWKEFADARLGTSGRRDGRRAGRRRSQLRRPRCCARRGVQLRGDRRGNLQALILAGGEGTRLRPLTSSTPKPVVPLAGRPFISYMIEWLRRHGVDEAILSCGFMADGVRAVLGDGAQLGLRLRYVEEPEPLGTGGALKFAEDLLEDRFLMLNGDQLTDIDLTAQLRQHERTGARATLALIAVEDPSAYGLVRRRDDLSVTEFVEKPSADQIDTNLVNAGRVRARARGARRDGPAGTRISIERDVFPELVGRGLFGYEASGYWLDIGTPQRYLQATYDILDGAIMTEVGRAVAASGGVSGTALAGTAPAPAARCTRRP